MILLFSFQRKLSNFKLKKINCILSNNFYKCKQFFLFKLFCTTFVNFDIFGFINCFSIFFSVKYKIKKKISDCLKADSTVKTVPV